MSDANDGIEARAEARDPQPEAGAAPAGPASGQLRRVLAALVANRLAVFGLVVLALLAVAALLGDQLAPYGLNEQVIEDRLQSPSATHWFGTDDLGRDVFSRVLLGASIELRIALVSVVIALVVGTTVGLVAGYRGGWLDATLMRAMDVLFSFPAVLLAIAIVAVLSPSVVNAMLAIGVVFTPIFARVVRGSVLSVREETYVTAVRSLGAGDLRIMVRHVLPNVAASIIVQTSLSLAFAILVSAALSFVGVGVQPPDPAWGRLLFEARGFIDLAWWMSVFPGLAIFAAVMGFNVVGDGLRDALDPKQRSVIEARGQEART